MSAAVILILMVVVLVAVAVALALSAPSWAAVMGTVCLPSCKLPSPHQAHCASCHETFGGATGFDAHRRHGECLSPEAMGLVRNEWGVWQRVVAPPARRREPQSPEQVEAGRAGTTSRADSSTAGCATSPRDMQRRDMQRLEAAIPELAPSTVLSGAKSPGHEAEVVTGVDG